MHHNLSYDYNVHDKKIQTQSLEAAEEYELCRVLCYNNLSSLVKLKSFKSIFGSYGFCFKGQFGTGKLHE